MSVMKNQSRNAKSQSEHAKIPKTQFENAKTQWRNWKTPVYGKFYSSQEPKWSKIAKFNWNSEKYGEILMSDVWVFLELQKNLINILKKTSKTQFENAKTQFENIKTQKTAQVVAWNSLDRRTKISPDSLLKTGCFVYTENAL